MNPQEITRLLAEQCSDLAATGWQDYLSSPDGDDPEDEPLDVIHLVGQNGQYHGQILVIAKGGPSIEIDTRAGAVYGLWAGSEAKTWLLPDDNRRLSEYFQDYYHAEAQNPND